MKKKVPPCLENDTCLFGRAAWFVALAALFFTPVVRAQVIWDGGGTDDFWSTGTNWDGNAAPSSGNAVEFSGTTRPSPVNDLTDGADPFLVSSISFTNTTTGGDFNVSGAALRLSGPISTTTGAASNNLADTVANNIQFLADITVTANTRHDLTLSGDLSEDSPSRSLRKLGGGTLTLTGLNSFSGEVRINNGSISANSIADVGSASALGAGNLIVVGNGGVTRTLRFENLAADQESNRQFQIGGEATDGTGGLILTNDDTDSTLTFDNAVFNVQDTTANTRSIQLSTNNVGANTISGVIQDNDGGAIELSKTGTGRWVLGESNTFTGGVQILAGTLQVGRLANYGVASSLGAASSGVIQIGSNNVSTPLPTLLYVGDGDSSDRQFQIGGGTATTHNGNAGMINDGTGALTFTAGTFNVAQTDAANTGTRVLILAGSYTGSSNEIQGVIQNNGNASDALVGVTKTGAASWILSGPNTYTGATSVDEGTLTIANSSTTSGTTLSGTGTLNLNHAGSLGPNGDLTLTGGTLDTTGAGDLVLTTTGNVALNGDFDFGGSHDLSIANGTSSMSGARTITLGGVDSTLALGTLSMGGANGATLTVNGSGNRLVLGGVNLVDSDTLARNRNFLGDADIEITGPVLAGPGLASGSLTYSGSGTLTLSGANNYDGTTTVSSGTVTVESNVGDGNTTLADGATLNLNAATALNAAGNLIANGGTIDNTSGGAVNVTSTGTMSFTTSATTTVTFGGTNALTLNQLVDLGTQNRELVFQGSAPVTLAGNISRSGTVARTLTIDTDTNASVTLSGVIDETATGDLALTKTGLGLLTLSNSGNAYEGATTVQAGTLRLNGSTGDGGTVSVATGATLEGTGTINGALSVAGTLAPGNSPGVLTATDDVTFEDGSTYSVELLGGTTAGTDYDQLRLLGSSLTLSLNGANNLQISLAPSFASIAVLNDLYFLADLDDAGSSLTGIFESLNGTVTPLNQGDTFTVSGYEFMIGYTGNSAGNAFTGGNDLVLQYTAVPEPGVAFLLALSALIALIAWRRLSASRS